METFKEIFMKNELLKEIILEQQEYQLPDVFVARQIYDEVVNVHDNLNIIVITGVRRCGKSTLLQEIRSKLPEKNYYINFDDDRLVQFKLEDFQALLELFIELFGLQKTFYFDEIQNIPEWERFVRRLHDQGNKIYITGSNATMFSRELGTRLTGRYIAIEMYPFSFREYVSLRQPDLLDNTTFTSNQKGTLKNLWSRFAIDGGIPNYVIYPNKLYLQTLYESILYRDIVSRYKVNERSIKELVFYLASNVSKEITYNSLRKTLGLASATTVSDYCSYLENSFLCFFVNRYDYSLKKQLQYAKKVYFIDQAIAHMVGFRFSEDHGRLLENIVFLELKRRHQDIYFHKQRKECDFIIRAGNNITAAVQVCTSLDNDNTKQRELAGLIEAMEIYQLSEGLIITANEEGTETITHNNSEYIVNTIPIWKWLLHY